MCCPSLSCAASPCPFLHERAVTRLPHGPKTTLNVFRMADVPFPATLSVRGARFFIGSRKRTKGLFTVSREGAAGRPPNSSAHRGAITRGLLCSRSDGQTAMCAMRDQGAPGSTGTPYLPGTFHRVPSSWHTHPHCHHGSHPIPSGPCSMSTSLETVPHPLEKMGLVPISCSPDRPQTSRCLLITCFFPRLQLGEPYSMNVGAFVSCCAVSRPMPDT